jgi:hypothetical protein
MLNKAALKHEGAVSSRSHSINDVYKETQVVGQHRKRCKNHCCPWTPVRLEGTKADGLHKLNV